MVEGVFSSDFLNQHVLDLGNRKKPRAMEQRNVESFTNEREIYTRALCMGIL